jgi:hypothetical protein
LAGAFYRSCQDTLVLGACASLTTRTDLTFLGDKPAQDITLFVVNRQMLVSAKLANLWASIIAPVLSLFPFGLIPLFTLFHLYNSIPTAMVWLPTKNIPPD